MSLRKCLYRLNTTIFFFSFHNIQTCVLPKIVNMFPLIVNAFPNVNSISHEDKAIKNLMNLLYFLENIKYQLKRRC